MTEPRILAFDTSGAHCAAVVSIGDTVRLPRFEAMKKGQAERLMPMLDEVLGAEGMTWSDLDALAVGVGPGNFTGIRIAVSAARGLALALGKPAIGVSNFEVALATLGEQNGLVHLQGPRQTLYRQSFRNGAPVSPPDIVEEGDTVAPVELDWKTASGLIARVALARLSNGLPIERPVPLYVRAPDAAPSSDTPPVLLS